MKYSFGIDYNVRSSAHYRFINHLKYLSQRIFHDLPYDDEIEVWDVINKQRKEKYKCAETIAHFIQEHYNYSINGAEMLYLTTHITRVVKESLREK